MHILLTTLLATLLVGCAAIPTAANQITADTLAARKALHTPMIEQARETLREAADWQQLNTPTAPVSAMVK